MSPPPLEKDERRCRLMEAAVTVFARHGFRKASMDDVARAAQVSRQGLYLHFPTKEELFRETIRYIIERWRCGAYAALGHAGEELEVRLVRAFDAFFGGCMENRCELETLFQREEHMIGEMLAGETELFLDRIAQVFAESPRMEGYRRAGLTEHQMAEHLMVASEGLKKKAQTREKFVEGIRVAVKIIAN